MAATQGVRANRELDRDPTRTKTLRARFEGEMGRRFRRLKGNIRSKVGYEGDFFDLRANADPEGVFDFPTDPQRRREFLTWLREEMKDEIVEAEDFIGVREGRNYTAKYVRAAYARAIQDAGRNLRAEGIDVPDEDLETMFNLPVHESSLRRIYTRTYQNLDRITEPTAQAVREELTRGFAEGVNPREMATRINRRVDAIGLTRARVLARTETIAAHSAGTLDRYERMGVGEVTITAEFSTAGDRRVCTLCETLEGTTYTIQEARTGTFQYEAGENEPASLSGSYPVNPPIHPSCRCAWLPQVS